MNLTTKIALALLFVLVAALGMTSALNYLRFEQTLRTVLAQRIAVVANETSQDLRAGIDLGLRLENMENLPGLLERRVGMDEEMANISVFGCDGERIASVDQGTVNADVPVILLEAPQNTTGPRFLDDVAIKDVLLQDSLRQCAGVLRLTIDISGLNAKLSILRTEMLQSAGLGTLAIIPVLALLFVIMRRRHNVFNALNEDVARARAGMAPSRMPRDGDLLTRGEVEMVSLYREIRDRLPENTDEEDVTTEKKGGSA